MAWIVSLESSSKKDIKEMSMIELANIILAEEKEAMNFNDLYSKIAERKEFSDSEKEANIARFYTDLNVDGRFTTLGSNVWGLKRWYPINHIGETVVPEAKDKKEVIEEDFEELDDIELEPDEANFEVEDELFNEDEFNDEFLEEEDY